MRAFTAVEVLLSVLLLGVLALAAVMLVPPIGTYRLNAAANQVRSDIQYAQQNAVTTGQTSGVQFVNGGAYTVYQGTVSTPLLSPLTRSTWIVTLSTNYPNTVISGNYTVEFDNFGNPTTGGGGSVALVNGSITKTITVAANTGRVSVQ